MKTVGVVGASGFVGSALVEWLLAHGQYRVKALVHSTGNAALPARLGIRLTQIDLMSRRSLMHGLQDCDVVVNCSRGSATVMVKGLNNLLATVWKLRVGKFVHISSTAVFGDTFHTSVIDEKHSTRPARGSYGYKKLLQDQLVLRFARRGLPALSLCPPNITGPYSPFLLALVESLKNRTFALVAGGDRHVSVVDVRNLCHAIECAIRTSLDDGRRIIVADSGPLTWGELVRPYAELANVKSVRLVDEGEANAALESSRPSKVSIVRSVQHLMSSDVRSALRRDPGWNLILKWAIGAARRLPKRIQDSMRGKPQRRKIVSGCKSECPLESKWLSQQMRNVRFVSSVAESGLGYAPLVTPAQSARAFAKWYRTHFGVESPMADLLQVLA